MEQISKVANYIGFPVSQKAKGRLIQQIQGELNKDRTIFGGIAKHTSTSLKISLYFLYVLGCVLSGGTLLIYDICNKASVQDAKRELSTRKIWTCVAAGSLAIGGCVALIYAHCKGPQKVSIEQPNYDEFTFDEDPGIPYDGSCASITNDPRVLRIIRGVNFLKSSRQARPDLYYDIVLEGDLLLDRLKSAALSISEASSKIRALYDLSTLECFLKDLKSTGPSFIK